MIEVVQFFYLYVLPVWSLFSFVYLINLLIRKNDTFEKIEAQFRHSIEKNKESSDEAINTYFINSLKYTKKAIDDFNESEQLIKLTATMSDIIELQKVLLKESKQLIEENKNLNKIIKEKEAIINRKSQQIARFKEKK